jgi:hypothetical protein
MVVDIACDESGYEGEKLVGGVTRVFAHASVRLDEAAAAACVAELRRLIRSPATEYKANHVLRSKHRPVLLWLLSADGPLAGNAHVYLIDKTFYLVQKLAEVLLPGAEAELFERVRDRPEFLRAANDLLRSRAEEDVETPFFDVLRDSGDRTLEALAAARDQAKAFRQAQPLTLPILDPLWAAIIHATGYWGGPVSIAHDRQTTLSPDRIAALQTLAAGGLAELTLHESFSHPRVQVADFLAGVARRIAENRLNGHDDPEVTELLQPFTDQGMFMPE